MIILSKVTYFRRRYTKRKARLKEMARDFSEPACLPDFFAANFLASPSEIGPGQRVGPEALINHVIGGAGSNFASSVVTLNYGY